MAKLRTGRTRIKKRNNGIYKIVMVVGEDPEGTVDTIEVSILPQFGVTPSPETFSLTKGATSGDNTKYIYKYLTMSGGNPIGQPFLIAATMKNASGGVVGATQNFHVTVQDNDGINITGVSLTQNAGAEDFCLRAVIKGTNFANVASITALLTPEAEGSVATPNTFELDLVKETSAKKVFKEKHVIFAVPSNVVDMEYIAALTLLDANGDELDYAQFCISGL